MTKPQSFKFTPKIVLKIVFYGGILAAFIFFLNFAVFWLLNLYVSDGVLWYLGLALLLEGIYMIIYAAQNLSKPYRSGRFGYYDTVLVPATKRQPEFRFPARPMAAAIVAVAGGLLFVVGFLLLFQVDFLMQS